MELLLILHLISQLVDEFKINFTLQPWSGLVFLYCLIIRIDTYEVLVVLVNSLLHGKTAGSFQFILCILVLREEFADTFKVFNCFDEFAHLEVRGPPSVVRF